ncbi:MAG: hypothetical protein RL240_298 [Planctomycetota bacterium]|jgi:hypothetical protein
MVNHTGLFGWIREGVKQSVLLGVSDAMEVLGNHDPSEGLHPNVAAALAATDGSASSSRARRVVQKSPEANETGEPVLTNGPRKRLGKSLKDINPTGVTKPMAAKGSAAPAPKS